MKISSMPRCVMKIPELKNSKPCVTFLQLFSEGDKKEDEMKRKEKVTRRTYIQQFSER